MTASQRGDIPRVVGLLDAFKRKSPVEKAIKELCEPYSQPEYRRTAMATLLDMGTEEAHKGLLKRFTFNANGHIADESEKRDLVEEIVRIGVPMVGPLKGFIRTQKNIGFPLRALSRIVPKAEVAEFLIETLTAIEPLDHRTTEQKRALVTAIGDLNDSTYAKVIAPYLKDHHDDVQFQAIEVLERLEDPGTYDALAEVCVGDDHGPRIQRRAAQALATLGHSVKSRYSDFSEEIRDEYILGKKGVLVKKANAK